MKPFSEFFAEAAPPGEDAEDWINSNKQEFKDKYGEDWDEVLYATAWKIFGKKKQVQERGIVDAITNSVQKVMYRNEYKAALQALIDVMKRKKATNTDRHDINYYAAHVAKSFMHVDDRELAELYQNTVTESEAAANTTAGVATADAPFKVSKFAGCDCIEVDADTYMKCKFGKRPYAKWSGYVEDENLRTFVQKRYSTAKALMIVNSQTGAATYLRR